jgi:hypothetical protein
VPAIRLFARTENAVLVIEETPDGMYLYQFRRDGFIGDTWHKTVDEAQAQASYSFGVDVSAWKDVPDTITDLTTFARRNLD